MEKDKSFQLTITTRSPVHISSGSTLGRNIDFVYIPTERTSFVVNVDAAAYLADPDRPDWQSLDQLLKAHEINLSRSNAHTHIIEGIPLVRYMLKGKPGNQKQQMLEQTRDVFDKPYIPGSSLKGAIRTALAWDAFPTSGLEVSLDALEVNREPPKKEFADENYERRLFVAASGETNTDTTTDAHRDVMRGLRISDTTPVAKELCIYQVGSSTEQHTQKAAYGRPQDRGQQQQRGPIPLPDVEGIPRDSTCTAVLQLDRYLFTRRLERIDFSDRAAWIERFAQACHTRSKKLIQQEIAYFDKRNQILKEFYLGLDKEAQQIDKEAQQIDTEAQQLDPKSFLLQLGWGAGWHSKTLDARLTDNGAGFREIANHYELKRGKTLKDGDIFPISRKLVKNDAGDLAAPLGWVRVDVKEQP